MSISPSGAFNRTSGTAPLYEHLDLTATTASTTSFPFHDLIYYTDWKDPSSGNYSNGLARSKNFSYGPIAAHVYETPGTYTPITYFYDGATLASLNSTTITVNDPDVVYSGTNTVCYSNAGLSSGGPAGCAYATTSSMATYIGAGGTGKRILANRGDTYTSAAQVNVPAGISNYTYGAWGTGAAPILSNTVAGAFSAELSINTSTDGRFMDLHLVGTGTADIYAVLLSNGSGNSQITFLRVENETQSFCYNLAGSSTPDQFCIASSHMHDIGPATVGYGGIFEFTKFALIDNFVENLHPTSGGTHVAHDYRIGKGIKGVLSNNTLQDNYGGSLIKMHAQSAVVNTQYVVVSDNKLISSANSSNSVDFGPEIPAVDELVLDVIFERNWVIYGSGMGNPYVLDATTRVTTRNNIFDGSLATLATKLMRIFTDAATNVPHDNWTYNNTFYTSDTGSMNMILNDTNAQNSIFKNNIGWAPNMTSPVMISDAGTGTTGASGTFGNSSNANVKSNNPFLSSSPAVPADYKLNGAAYAKASGSAVMMVYDDFFDLWRTGTMDGGAEAFDETGTPPWASPAVYTTGIAPRLFFSLP